MNGNIIYVCIFMFVYSYKRIIIKTNYLLFNHFWTKKKYINEYIYTFIKPRIFLLFFLLLQQKLFNNSMLALQFTQILKYYVNCACKR